MMQPHFPDAGGALLLQHSAAQQPSKNAFPLSYVGGDTNKDRQLLDSSTRARFDADDASRIDEPWTKMNEDLLQEWAGEWAATAEAHSAAESKKKFLHRCFQIPNVLIPVIVAPLLAAKLVAENHPAVVVALVLSSVAGGVISVMQWERMSEQHAQAAFRYADLLSDAEELLAKQRRFRPGCDVTMQSFKMRMDNAANLSPSVSPVNAVASRSLESDEDSDSSS